MPDAVIHPTSQELTAFGLGKLPERTAAAIAAHLESCAACRQAVAGVSADSFLDKVRDARPAVPNSNFPPELTNHAKYHILRELGRGGMGVVYQARHKEMERQVVIKVINRSLLDRPDSLERFRREIRSAAQLSHPNIVTAYDAERAGESHMLVMEFVPGQSLAEVVKKKGPLPISVACHFARQVALGLQHAYERGMVHRDIKPQNLMLTPKGQVKILDFGLAKLVREEGKGTGITSENAYLGTPDYCAPEQATDASKADIRADLYSLGCTLYYLLSGGPPFREDTVVKAILAHQQKQPQPLPELRPEAPGELWQVLTRLLAKDPAKRYEKPIEVAQALVPFIKSGSKQDAKGSSALQQSTASPREGTVFELETSEDKKIPRGLREKEVRAEQPPAQAAIKEEKQPEAASVWEALMESSIASDERGKDEVIRKPRTATGRERRWRKKRLIGYGLGVGVLLLGMWTIRDRLPFLESLKPKPETSGTLTAEVHDAEDDGLIDPNPYLFIRFHDWSDDDAFLKPTMRFGLHAKGPDRPDLTKKLTYDEHGRTNNTVIRMDGQEFIFGNNIKDQPPGKWIEMNRKLRGDMAGRKRDGLASVWLLPNGKLEVTQEAEIVPGTQSRRLDTCLVRYILKNRDTIPHQVGIRFMLDTFIGETDGVPFFIPSYWDLCDTEISFNSPDRVPDFVQAVEKKDLRNPGTVAYLQFRIGKKIESPSQVQIGGWPNPELQKIGIQLAKAQLTGWNVPFISMKERIDNKDNPDSAVTMYWHEKALEPGKTRVVGFTYGLGNVDSHQSGGHLLLTAGGRLVPNVDFSLMALVHNPKPDETLTLEPTLPVGIETVGQQMTQRVPGIPPGASTSISPVTWRLRASKAGRYELSVVSSTGAKQKLPLTIRPSGMFD